MLRRDQLCDPHICPDREEHEERCATCPLDRLDAALAGNTGALIRRATDMKAIMSSGITITLDEINADELYAMLIVQEERDRLEEERHGDGQR